PAPSGHLDRDGLGLHRGRGALIFRIHSAIDLGEGPRIVWRASRAVTAPRSSAAPGAAGGQRMACAAQFGSKVPTLTRKANLGQNSVLPAQSAFKTPSTASWPDVFPITWRPARSPLHQGLPGRSTEGKGRREAAFRSCSGGLAEPPSGETHITRRTAHQENVGFLTGRERRTAWCRRPPGRAPCARAPRPP